jgi:hypothetical protein
MGMLSGGPQFEQVCPRFHLADSIQVGVSWAHIISYNLMI